MTRAQLCIFGKTNKYDIESFSDHHTERFMSLSIITGDVFLSHLVKLMSGGVSTIESPYFPLIHS